VQLSILQSLAIQHAPDRRADQREDYVEQILDVRERGVAASGGEVGGGFAAEVEDVYRDPGAHCFPQVLVRLREHIGAGIMERMSTRPPCGMQ